jgi:hypothetical protein
VTEISIGGDTKIIFYSSVKELPIELSKKMQNYLLQQIGVGSTVQDIDDHLERLTTFLSADKKEEAIEEVKNLRFAYFSAINGLRYDTLAFACLLYSINGKKIEDYSTEGLQALIIDLSSKGLTNEKVEAVLDEVKKNLIRNGNFTFLMSSRMM